MAERKKLGVSKDLAASYSNNGVIVNIIRGRFDMVFKRDEADRQHFGCMLSHVTDPNRYGPLIAATRKVGGKDTKNALLGVVCELAGRTVQDVRANLSGAAQNEQIFQQADWYHLFFVLSTILAQPQSLRLSSSVPAHASIQPSDQLSLIIGPQISQPYSETLLIAVPEFNGDRTRMKWRQLNEAVSRKELEEFFSPELAFDAINFTFKRVVAGADLAAFGGEAEIANLDMDIPHVLFASATAKVLAKQPLSDLEKLLAQVDLDTNTALVGIYKGWQASGAVEPLDMGSDEVRAAYQASISGSAAFGSLLAYHTRQDCPNWAHQLLTDQGQTGPLQAPLTGAEPNP